MITTIDRRSFMQWADIVKSQKAVKPEVVRQNMHNIEAIYLLECGCTVGLLEDDVLVSTISYCEESETYKERLKGQGEC